MFVRNHHDNYFLMNVAYRSEANLINGRGGGEGGEIQHLVCSFTVS